MYKLSNKTSLACVLNPIDQFQKSKKRKFEKITKPLQINIEEHQQN
jgi:hypothetical protein